MNDLDWNEIDLTDLDEDGYNPKEFHLYGFKIQTRRDFHQQLAEEMQLPEYYGNNLDALMDVLTDLGEETILHIHETEAMRETLGSYVDVINRVLVVAADENMNFSFTFL